MRRFVIFFLFAFLLFTAAHGWAIEADAISPGSWTMVILPDTQHYAEDFPHIFYAQTEWIAAHKDSHNIQMVIHEGDITDRRTPIEWTRAATAMVTLNTAGVPYSMCIGNHDRDGTTRETLFNDPTYFGPGSPYASQPQFQPGAGGFFEAGKTANSWSTFNAGGQDWLIFSVEYGPNDEMVSWMDTVAAAHPNHNFILNTHVYLYYDNTRYDYATYGSTQTWSPHDWDAPDSVNDGQELWDKLVKKYPTWKFTFNGHVLADGTGWLGSTGDHGNAVHQLLTNYQTRDQGGEGYLRIMEFKDDGKSVTVSSYSPYLGSYLRAYDHDFTLNMNEVPTIRGVSGVALDVADGTNAWTIAGSGAGSVAVTSPANMADVSLAVNSVPTYRNQGVLMATVRQNSRGGSYGTVEVSHRNLFDGHEESVFQIATSRAYYGAEYNMNVAAAIFPFADGWIGGHVQNDGALLEHYGVSVDNISHMSAGRFTLSIDNINSQTDGMLFAVSAQNGFNFLSTAPLTNGSGWEIATRDNTAAAFDVFEDNPWSFVYVDYDSPGLTGARIAPNGTTIHAAGSFSVSRLSVGVYRISVPGYTPGQGVLLLTIAGFEAGGAITAPGDNIISYEADGSSFLVNIRDRSGSVSNLQDGELVFAFLPYEGRLMPAVPGDANYDGVVDSADASILARHWGNTSATWAMGDFNLDGVITTADASILAANWGNHGSSEGGSVPEPGAIALVLTGFISLTVRSRWCRRE
ncbi:MAG TPA: hypothetical protein DD670_00530 [Planctomycetaceae bacterium]|nr:hypothetical protein [Planctomycetaceae bacterium]